MPSRGDADFGRAALEKGYLSDKILRIYLKKVRQLETRGQRTSVDALLLFDKLLSAGQVTEIQLQLERRVQFCPHCGAKHNVVTIPAGERVRCTKCSEGFEIVDWSTGSPPRPVAVHLASSGSSAEWPQIHAPPPPSSGMDDEDDDDRFECPECGAALRLEDEFCRECHPPGGVEHETQTFGKRELRAESDVQ